MAQIGHLALVLAFVLSSCALPVDLVGKWRNRPRLIRTGRDATILSFGCLSIAMITLVIALISGDFDILYVVRHTSSASSIAHRIGALWAGAGGSLLLWLWVQAGFVATVFCRSAEGHTKFCAHARVVANLVCVFFLLTLTLEINPFAVSETASYESARRGLCLRRPILLLGYAASVVPFAWSFAWLKWDVARGPVPLFRQVRHWILPAWLCLTVGAALSVWSAYAQHGSESSWLRNALLDVPLMPWLPATALLCGSRILQRDAAAAKWIVVFSLITFSSCILTTFLGRPDMPTGARKLFIILLIHIWALAAISLWRRHRHSRRSDKTRELGCDR